MRKLTIFLLLFFGGVPGFAQVTPTRIITLKVQAGNEIAIFKMIEGKADSVRDRDSVITLTPAVTDDDPADDVKVAVKRGDEQAVLSLAFTKPQAQAFSLTITLLDIDVRTNLPTTGLGYTEALARVDAGHAIRRIAWNNRYLVLDARRSWPYTVTEADRLALDWLVVEE